jgi:hypothetical protein
MEGVMPSQPGKMHHMIRRMTAAGHFNALPAGILEIIKKTPHVAPGHLVTPRMGNHRHATGAIDPANRLFQRRPAMVDVTRLARRQVMLKERLETSRAMPIDTM